MWQSEQSERLSLHRHQRVTRSPGPKIIQTESGKKIEVQVCTNLVDSMPRRGDYRLSLRLRVARQSIDSCVYCHTNSCLNIFLVDCNPLYTFLSKLSDIIKLNLFLSYFITIF